MVVVLECSKSGVMLFNPPWLLTVAIVLLLATDTTYAKLHHPENKLTDVRSEEGAIDQLEEFLLSQHQRPQQLGSLHGTPVKSDPIEFGVRPNDPRYFAGRVVGPQHNRQGAPDLRLQMRGDPQLRVQQMGGQRLGPSLANLYDEEEYYAGGGQREMERADLDDRAAYYDTYNNGAVRGVEREPSDEVIITNPETGIQHRSDNNNNNNNNKAGHHMSKPSSTPSYNPNDPSASADDAPAESAKQQQSAAPQHYQQSHHSALSAQSSVGPADSTSGFSDIAFVALVAGVTAAAVCGVIGTGVCWYKLSKNQRAAKDAEYPAYGVTGPSRELSPGSGSGGDRTLAHSAHMYHYQQQKNQMIAIDKSGVGDGAGGGGQSDVDSEEDEEGEDRDYTVYECPGLAPMGEMVVPNPMYPAEDGSPGSPSLKEELERAAEED